MKQLFFFLIGIFVFSASLCAQNPDSTAIKTDSVQIRPVVDSVKPIVTTRPLFKLENKLLNSNAEPVSFAVQGKKENSKEDIFYLIAGMALLLAFFKYFYNRYFTNLFRVFFNTSLRQSQLTDQLLQAKLPSLLFNLFFLLSGGLYVYILLLYFQVVDENKKWIILISSIAILGSIYLIKYCTLKFTGWITGLKEITNTYIFIIFLINKIIGIFLIPFIIILSFSDSVIVKIAVIISLMSIGIFVLLRFFRSYSILQNQFKISRFHFILYISGIELLPLLLIYKALMGFLNKNL